MNLSEIQVDGEALRWNVRQLRGLSSARVAAVVKGNAYGHGLAEVVSALEGVVDAFQVDDLEELRALRAVTSKRAFVFGFVPLSSLAEAVALGGELTIYDAAQAAALAGLGARVHLKVDALLGRLGVLPTALLELVGALGDARAEVVGAYAHFANIEDTTDLSHAQAQMEVFESCLGVVRERFPLVERHVSATSGLMALGSSGDWVRLGIGIYGLYPSAALSRTWGALELRPAMRWVSHLAQVKELPAGHPVGYGLTFRTSRPMRVGIVPQGYADGYDRGLSNSGEVLVCGRRCPVIGRVAMNMFAVDLTLAPEARLESEVVLLGSQGSEVVSAEEIASRLGTINYEVIARVSPQLPRALTR